MTRHAIANLAFVVLAVSTWLASLTYIVRARDSRWSITRLLLAGPMLFVVPEKYFVEGRRSAPWRALLGWTVALVLTTALVHEIKD